jgi:hypothetical protein
MAFEDVCEQIIFAFSALDCLFPRKILLRRKQDKYETGLPKLVFSLSAVCTHSHLAAHIEHRTS